MRTIGVDAHKRVHAAVAVDDGGREIGQWRGPKSVDGWQALAAWAKELGAPSRWGIEGARGYGRGLAQALVADGAEVYDSNPRWTAAGRWRARRTDKHDRRDAQAIALLVWRQAGDLSRVAADDETAVLDLLVTERTDRVAGSTRLRNQRQHLLLQCDPEYATRVPSLRTQAGLRALESDAVVGADPLQRQRAGGYCQGNWLA